MGGAPRDGHAGTESPIGEIRLGVQSVTSGMCRDHVTDRRDAGLASIK